MCLFCDIADHSFTGAYIVNETERTVSFLDIAPANEGHVLIVPKLHVDSIIDLPNEYVLEIAEVSRRIIKAYSSVYGAKGYGVMQNGGANCCFGHFHFHVFPRFADDGYDWIYPAGEKEVSEQVAAKLKSAIG
jgi:histidine triad (HIT) family protein